MKALAGLLVRSHPRPWRARYEDEVMELLDANRLRMRDLFDLFKSGVTERVLSLYEPSHHIARFRLISGMVVTVLAAAFLSTLLILAGGPFAAGYLLSDRFGSLSPVLHEVAGWLRPVFLILTWVFFHWFFRLRSRGDHSAPWKAMDIRLAWGVIVGCMVASFLGGVTADGSSSPLAGPMALSFLILLQVLDPSEIRWPTGNLLEVLGRHRRTQYDLRWARMELERCEGLYEGREAGPELRAARSAMDRLHGEEARAIADLDAMGYHARFQS